MIHSNNRPLKYLINHHEESEILRDAYISALTQKTRAALQIREYYNEWEGDEAIARQRVSIFMKGHLQNKARLLRGRLKLIKENGDLIIENTHSKSQNTVAMMNNIFGLRLSDEDKILVCWKMDIISTEDAMKKIDCSRQTLYNKWTPLAQALKEMI
jgi:hypothetical protein